MGRIDLAWFNCDKCGHRCTPPDVINIISHEMEPAKEILRVIDKIEDETLTKTELEAVAITEKTQLSTKHQGNTFNHNIIMETDDKFKKLKLKIKFDRSYAKVLFQSDTELIKSKEITLGCPECDNKLYEVKFGG